VLSATTLIIALNSVSGDPKLRPNVVQMGNWLEQQLTTYGVETRQVDLNTNSTAEPKLPPIILGKIGNSPMLKTLLVYGHYDVQPVSDFSTMFWSSLFRLKADMVYARPRNQMAGIQILLSWRSSQTQTVA
jgi:acetylornithine deacetylase/succinyl-diaminopimelate desuccinylase-like protein